MGLNRNSLSAHPLSRVVIWGNPRHGLVEGGQLTLPNATQITWEQPYAPFMDRAGYTQLLEVPGTPAVVRTDEQQAADAAAGLEWRAKALLAGGAWQLYGKHLSGWIYVDPAGDRWLVRAPGLDEAEYLLGAAPVITITLRRFGVFGRPEEVYTHNVQITAWGQGDDDYITHNSVVVDRARLIVDAVTKTGDKAVVMLHARRSTYPSAGRDGETADKTVRWPMGFLLLTISGPGDAAVLGFSVLRTRSQTLKRTIGGSDAMSAAYYAADTTFNEPWPPGSPPGDRDGDLIATPLLVPGATPDAFGKYVGVNSGTTSSSVLIQRLVAVWLNADGDPVEVVMELDYASSGTYPEPVESAPIPTVTTSYVDDVAVSRSGTHAQVELTRTATLVETIALRLKVGADVVDAISASLTTTSEQAVYHRHNAPALGTQSADYSNPFTDEAESREDTTFSGAFDGAAHAHGPFPFGGLEAAPAHVGGWISRLVGRFASVIYLARTSPDGADAVFNFATDWRIDFPSDASGNSVEYHGRIARQSPQVIGMAVRKWEIGIPVSGRPITYRTAATPSGDFGQAQSVPFVANERFYASWNAFNGSTVWMNAGPVCWV